MKKNFIYLETGSADPYYNLAFEEYVLTRCRTGNYLILWQNDSTIVVGLNQNTEAEINRAYVEEHKIRVVRRSTGGGAVYHDLGNLNYSFITDRDASLTLTKAVFTDPIVSALQKLGLCAEASGRNDILVDGKKVSGTAERVDHDRVLHHGTLLFDSDPEAVAGALSVDPEMIRSKGIRSVKSRIGNIRPMLKEDMDLPSFWTYLLTFLLKDGGSSEEADLAPASLPPEAIPEILHLREKYASWEWNFGRSAAFETTKKRRFPGGTVECGLSCENGRIRRIRFFGDFLALRSMEDLCAALEGIRFSPEDVKAALQPFDLAEYFGSVTEEEVLSLLFS